MQTERRRVVLGMSGGVDSSVSLYLLKKSGFEPIGVSLRYKTWSGCKRENSCCTEESFQNAKKVCNYFETPHQIIDVSEEFEKDVIGYFMDSLKKSVTPSPCVICNPKVKFEQLLKYADKIGANFIATGHYARIKKGETFELHKPRDKDKDQTYSLSFLTQKELSRCIFPLGSFTKHEVENIAGSIEGLSFYNKIKQSQDFCFLGKDELPLFIDREIKQEIGEIYDDKGSLLGKHRGLSHYTIGQRGGIGITGGPFFVLNKDRKKNRLIVTRSKELVSSRELFLKPFNIVSGDLIKNEIIVEAKIRSSGQTNPAIIKPEGDGLSLIFKKKQFAPTPGQIAVFYSGEICLGAGVIN